MSGRQRQLIVTLGGGRGSGDDVHASALVSAQGFGVRYDLDQVSGIITNPDHDLCGQSLRGHILVFTQPKGGVAASWSLADLRQRGLAPLGIVFQRASPIFVQGALSAGLAIVDNLDGDPCQLIRSGDEVALYPRTGRVEVYR